MFEEDVITNSSRPEFIHKFVKSYLTLWKYKLEDRKGVELHMVY